MYSHVHPTLKTEEISSLVLLGNSSRSLAGQDSTSSSHSNLHRTDIHRMCKLTHPGRKQFTIPVHVNVPSALIIQASLTSSRERTGRGKQTVNRESLGSKGRENKDRGRKSCLSRSSSTASVACCNHRAHTRRASCDSVTRSPDLNQVSAVAVAAQGFPDGLVRGPPVLVHVRLHKHLSRPAGA